MDGRDDIDQASGSGVGWPLVERRQGRSATGDGPERRQRAADGIGPDVAGPVTAPMWPFRLLALAGAFVEARHDLQWRNWELITSLAVASVYAITAIVRPIPYRDDLRTRFRIVVELALHTALVLLTTSWSSPVAICLIPTAMLAGFATGTVFAIELMAASVAVVTVQHLTRVDITEGAQDAALWAGVLGVVAFTSGLTQRASADAARQQHAALERVNRLAEANSLLFALQRVAQSMPASLDLDDIADTTLKRVRSLIPGESVALYLTNEGDRRLEVFRNTGTVAATTISLDQPPSTIRSAIDAPRTLRLTTMRAGSGLGATSRSGIYAALRARGTMVGLLAVESDDPEAFTQQHSEIVHGLAEPFGIAIDNSRLFRQLRSASANEERRRIARDLHDQVGSSLAFLGFEVDRATHLAAEGEPMEEVLVELRQHLTTVINDIRETLHDLRTDVTDERDLPATIREHLARVADRRRLATELHVDATFRPPRQVERELWQIALEAITNVEKHAQASTVRVSFVARDRRVTLQVVDDGIGLNTTTARADRYGMVGMRERAEGIGASLRVEAPARGGTSVTVTFDSGEATP